jgi:hypothetical protein
MSGSHVKTAEAVLAKNKFGSFYHGAIDGQFGPMAAQSAATAKRALGYPLAQINETCGDLLISYLRGAKPLPAAYKLRRAARLKAAPKLSLGEKAFNEAVKWVGTKESPAGSNLNPFGKWYGANGVSWCAEFVSYCLSKAGSKFKYAYVPYVVNDARSGRNGLSVVSKASVRHGDLVCFDWPGESPGVADHIGFFDHWVNQAAGTFATVEGNTSPDDHGDQSNGGEVCRKLRYVSNVQVFVRVSA